MKPKTSWGGVADWYHNLLKEEGSYQKEVILPNLLRLLDFQRGEIILDLACGEGFFSRAFSRNGIKVIGVDVARDLIALARENSPKTIQFEVASANRLSFISDASIDKAVVVLAIQNIDDVSSVLKECRRVLRPGGRLFLVMNHPAFRIPKGSAWGWDEVEKKQYRRIDSYLSEAKVKIDMHPGDDPDQYTLSFHRPLQFYFKSLAKNGFLVGRLEEWNSNKKSSPGTRSEEENRIRKEIPLFLLLEAHKV